MSEILFYLLIISSIVFFIYSSLEYKRGGTSHNHSRGPSVPFIRSHESKGNHTNNYYSSH